MMSLVRMALLLLSSWLVCHSFISTIPAVSSATRLYSRRQSSAHRDRRDAVPLANDDSSRNSADFNSLPKSSDRERSLSTDGMRVEVRQTEDSIGNEELLLLSVGNGLYIDPRKLNRTPTDWDPARMRTSLPTDAPYIETNMTILVRIVSFNRPPNSSVTFGMPRLTNRTLTWDPIRLKTVTTTSAPESDSSTEDE